MEDDATIITTGVSVLMGDSTLEVVAVEETGTSYVDDDAAALVATGVVSVSTGDRMLVIAADETGTSYVDDEAAMVVATGVLSVSTDVVSVDTETYVVEVGMDGDSELNSTSDVVDGADSLEEVLEGREVPENSGDVRITVDCGDDSVPVLRVSIEMLDGKEVSSETVVAVVELLPKDVVDAAADGVSTLDARDASDTAGM